MVHPSTGAAESEALQQLVDNGEVVKFVSTVDGLTYYRAPRAVCVTCNVAYKNAFNLVPNRQLVQYIADWRQQSNFLCPKCDKFQGILLETYQRADVNFDLVWQYAQQA